MKKTRIGIIGCGWAGNEHAQAIKELSSEADLAAVCDIDEDKVKKFAVDHNVSNHTKNYRNLLEDKLIDAVSICLPHDLHASVAVEAAAAGLHVLVEKPVCATLDEADQMIEAAERNRVVLMVAETSRYTRLYQKVHELLAGGAIGNPFLFRISREIHMRDYFDDKRWFLQDSTGGIMYSGGIHDFDLLRMIAGEVEHVYALQAVKSFREMAADDTSVALAHLVSGAAGIIIESFSIKTAAGGVKGIIHGERGTLSFDRSRRLIELFAPEDSSSRTVKKIQCEEQNFFLDEIKDFVDCVRENRVPLSSAGEGKKTLACVVAAYESMKTGKAIFLG